jgi:hypothetical protein
MHWISQHKRRHEMKHLITIAALSLILIGCGGSPATSPQITNGGTDNLMPSREITLISAMNEAELYRHFAAEFANTQDENARCYVYETLLSKFEECWTPSEIMEFANGIEEAQGHGLPDEPTDPPC